MRRILWTCLLLSACAATTGCDNARPTWWSRPAERAPVAPPAPVEPAAPVVATPAPTAPATPARPAGGVMAYVNDHAIGMEPLHELLLHSHGLEMAQQLIANELVNAAATKRGLTVSEEEIFIEHAATLKEMFPGVPEPDQRQRLWEQMLVRRSVSRRQWDQTMARNVLLGKLVAPDVTVTPSDIEQEFADECGRKVVVRHIQLDSLDEAREVLDRLDAGEGFDALARELSKNPSAADGGLLPPIGSHAEGLPPAFRDEALSLRYTGDLAGPIQIGTSYHLLYLEREIAPQDVQIEDVREKLAQRVRTRRIRSLQQKVLADMIREAKIEYVDPVLSSQAAEAQKEATRD